MSTRAPAVLKNTAEDVALGARVFNGVNFFDTSITRIYRLSSLMLENGAHICDPNNNHTLLNMPDIILS